MKWFVLLSILVVFAVFAVAYVEAKVAVDRLGALAGRHVLCFPLHASGSQSPRS